MEQRFCSFHAIAVARVIIAIVVLLVIQVASQTAQSMTTHQQSTGDLEVSDQSLVNNTLTIRKVTASQDGWLAVFLDEGGRHGKRLGQTAVKQGENTDVKVQLSEPIANGSKVWPRLHIDAGTIGTFEFPGADSPSRDASGNVVTKQITITAASNSPAQLPNTGGTDDLWKVLLFAGITFIVGARLVWWVRQRTT